MALVSSGLMGGAAYGQAQHVEAGDAGNILVAGFQNTIGSGTLRTIVGATNTAGGDVHDAYAIRIDDPDSFYATTSSDYGLGLGGSSFDTRLYLFQTDGRAVMANDDDFPTGNPFQSLLSDPADYNSLTGGGSIDGVTHPLVAGQTYLLVVSGFSEDAYDTSGGQVSLFNGFSDFDALQGVSGNDFLGAWESDTSGTPNSGSYTIELGGVSFAIPEPGSAIAVVLGLGVLGFRRRRG